MVNDYDLLFRISKKFELSNIDKTLVCNRQHESNLSFKKIVKGQIELLKLQFSILKTIKKFDIKMKLYKNILLTALRVIYHFLERKYLKIVNIVNFNGGLGNQLFQYSFGLAIKYEFGYDVKFFDQFINKKQIKIQDIFNVKYNLADSDDYSKIIGNLFINEQLRSYFLRIMRKFGIREFKNFIIKNYNYPFSSLTSLNNKFFYGYWQNFDFIKHLNSKKKP